MSELCWDGFVNIRDLGGLPTRLSPSGRTTRGRVARGPRRERLTTTGWADARRWGLHTIVDLRCHDEVGPRTGDPVVDPAASAEIILVPAPTEDHSSEEFREVCFPILDSPAYWPHNWRILPELVLNALVAISEASPGVLVHCSAGRDRTGMISALLLGNAGVPAVVVAGDYAASVRAMAGIAHNAPTHDRQATWDSEQVSRWLDDVVPLVIDVASDVGSVFDALGVSSKVRQHLRELLVSP